MLVVQYLNDYDTTALKMVYNKNANYIEKHLFKHFKYFRGQFWI